LSPPTDPRGQGTPNAHVLPTRLPYDLATGLQTSPGMSSNTVRSKIEFYRHALSDEDIAAAAQALREIFLTTGPRTAAFERELAEYLGVQQVVGVSSCTAALFLSLKALGVGPGDEVITTPMTFVATVNAILHTGATPVFVDVEPETGNIAMALVERAITRRTRVVIPVHLYGLMVDIVGLTDLSRRRSLIVIEDAAHALEAIRDGYRPGQLGQTACFSFYATKNLTSGEGGAVATNDLEMASALRRLRSHGLSKEAAGRYTERYRHWDMDELGYKANMTDIQAALLSSQLPRLDAQRARRAEIARRYEDGLTAVPCVSHPQVSVGATSAHHLFTIWVPPVRRDEMLAKLQDLGVGVAVNYRAVHLLSYFRRQFGLQPGAFPNAERIGDSTITLPLYPGMTNDDVDAVIAAVREVAAGWL
jgi:dTDP-4-amino-4,6-dideoxygalactose transaminase